MNDVQTLLKERKLAQSPVIARMEEVRRAYNGDMVVPLPELDKGERAAVANLVQQGIDQTAMRVASTLPGAYFPPLKVGVQREIKAARKRRDVVRGWWGDNKMNLKLRRRARWFAGYGSAPVMVRPGMDGQPTWHLREPLGTYPAYGLDPDEIVPPDTIFTYKRSREWLERSYPMEMARLNKSGDRLFDCVEYVDAEQILCYVCGSGNQDPYQGGGTAYEQLHQFPNAAERPLVVVPGRVTLDRILGQFDGVIGMYQLEAKIMSLWVIALERGIFPETWIVSNGQSTPEVITTADAKSGIVGRIEGGDIKEVTVNPGVFTGQGMDRLHGAAREEGGTPAEFSGVGSTNIRTGRRGEQVMSAAIDFRIQEAQELFEESLYEENRMAIAISKAYGGSRTYSMYIPHRGLVEYVPADDFPNDVHEVRYAYAGADANALTVMVGQKIGLETISRQTGMEIDPMIDDVETELDRITGETIQRAFMGSLQALAQDPNSPIQPSDWAEITRLVVSDKLEVYEAFQKVHDQAQKRQAAAQQAQQQGMQPGMGQPGAQPGLDAQQAGSIAAPAPGMEHLNYLLGDLNRSSKVA